MPNLKTYEINENELKCINILILCLQESINRNTFTQSEIGSIEKTIKALTKRQSEISRNRP